MLFLISLKINIYTNGVTVEDILPWHKCQILCKLSIPELPWYILVCRPRCVCQSLVFALYRLPWNKLEDAYLHNWVKIARKKDSLCTLLCLCWDQTKMYSLYFPNWQCIFFNPYEIGNVNSIKLKTNWSMELKKFIVDLKNTHYSLKGT